MKDTVCFLGEIMMRLSPPQHLRFEQASQLDVQYGGAEANVAISLGLLQEKVKFISRVPSNSLGYTAMKYLRSYGVNVDDVCYGGDKMGLYFLEHGALSRGGKVIYDRKDSSMSEISPGMINWDQALDHVGWLHWSGIIPAISLSAAQVTKEALIAAKAKGITISTDLNYRSKLWNYGKSPSEIMPELVDYCDVIIGDVGASRVFFGLEVPGFSFEIEPHYENYKLFMELLLNQFPNCKIAAATHRGSYSATHNLWCAMLHDRNEFYCSKTHDINGIVDRMGAGDSFGAGLIYGLRHFYKDHQKVIDFAVAASALKHSITGDANLVTLDEIMNLMDGDALGRVVR